MSYAIVPYRGGSSPVIYEGEIVDSPSPSRRRRRKKRSASVASAPAPTPKRRKAKKTSAKKTSAKKKATRKKKRTPAQIAATKRLVAANKARRGGKKTAGRKRKTSQKSAPRRSAPKRKKARRGPVGGAVRVRGSSGRAVTIVAPHKSAHSPCPSCGRYHDLRQHWSHKKGPHNYFTRTEASYSCARTGKGCAPKTRKTKTGKRKNLTKRRQSVQKPMTRAQAQILAVRAKWNARAKGR